MLSNLCSCPHEEKFKLLSSDVECDSGWSYFSLITSFTASHHDWHLPDFSSSSWLVKTTNFESDL